MSEPVLFVGGPWDGQMRMLEERYPNYNVRDYQCLGYPTGLKADTPTVNECVKHAEYQRYEIGNRVFYLIKPYGPEWRRKGWTPLERLMDMLALGYRRQ